MKPEASQDFDWDEPQPPGEPESDLRFSAPAQLAVGIGAFALTAFPAMLPLYFVAFYRGGQTDALPTIGLTFLLMAALRIQMRIAAPLSVDAPRIRLRFDGRVHELDAKDIAWVFRSAARAGSTEVGMVIGLKKRAFFGAKWLYTVGDRDGHVSHFLRRSGASLINWP